MSRFLSMMPSQQMRLEQRLTPQLIQSMEILQLALPALEARVREELAANPVLEESEAEAPAAPAAEGTEGTAKAPEKDATTKEAEAFDRLERISREYELDTGEFPKSRRTPPRDERDAKLDAIAATPSRGISLNEHLALQWALIDASPEIKSAGNVLIDAIDPDGYLRTETERTAAVSGSNGNGTAPLVVRRDEASTAALMDEIAHSVTPPIPLDAMEEALWLVQTLEPLGVGARDLTECLLIQLDAMPDAPPLTGEIVREHLLDVAKHRLPAIAKATGRGIEEIKEVATVLHKLDDRPGLRISPAEVPTISPDVIVDYSDEGDGYTVRLARGSSPRLRVSNHYRRMLEECKNDKTAREFLRKHVESATMLIDAIHYRRERLLQLAKVVVERQREFFDFGPQYLKVLRMRDLAEEFGCDASTVSRTVDEKYLQCPRGIYPLRMFFTGGTETRDGEEISWDHLRAKVKEIVEAEDKQNPLADEAIAEQMNTLGHPISRRTVAKYRAQLGIPPARQRTTY